MKCSGELDLKWIDIFKVLLKSNNVSHKSQYFKEKRIDDSKKPKLKCKKYFTKKLTFHFFLKIKFTTLATPQTRLRPQFE